MTGAVIDFGATYAAQQAVARASVLALLMAIWSRLTSWRDADAAAFTTAAVPVITGGQQHMAALTAAYLGQAIAAGGGVPGPLDLSGLTALRGVPAAVVYRRPFTQIWTDLSKGNAIDDAVSSAGVRLRSIAATDMQLAKTATAQRMLATAGKVTGYRRVLTGPSSCALCVLTSSRTYHKADLLPIHPGCSCTVAPLFDHEQAPDLATDVHAAVRATFGDKYVSASGATGVEHYRDLVVTHDHGELGPTLAIRGQAFTGPGDI